jgi:hypothetical protein
MEDFTMADFTPETMMVDEETIAPALDFAAETMTVEESPTVVDEASDFVVEEEPKTLPGSTMTVEDETEQAAKDTDWENDGDYSKFRPYFERRFHDVPKHSGNTIPGCERACSYCKDLQRELSSTMRKDLKGELDEAWADDMYKKLNDNVDRLGKQIDKLRAGQKASDRVFASAEVRLIAEGKCDKCPGDVPTWHDVENDRVVCLKCNAIVGSEGLEKIANTPKVNLMVSAFENAIVGSLINGACSGGKNIEDLYHKLETKYKFTDREKLAIPALLASYGYPMILDRVKIEDNNDENDGEMSKTYQA